MKVKIFLTIEVDPEDYPVPADGRVGEEIEDVITDMFYDVDGVEIKNMKTIME